MEIFRHESYVSCDDQDQIFQHISLLSQFFPHDFAFDSVLEEEYQYEEDYQDYNSGPASSHSDQGRFLGFSQPTFSRYRWSPLIPTSNYLMSNKKSGTILKFVTSQDPSFVTYKANPARLAVSESVVR